MSTHDHIDQLVKTNDVILFMKGTRTAPQCGFSATVVGILDDYLDEYPTVNVLDDPAIRQGIKDYSSWPTIPQLYVKGEFVGGCDIVKEMEQAGELSEVLGAEMQEITPPEVALTEAAVQALSKFHDGDGDMSVRVQISGRFEYGMDFDAQKPRDIVVEAPGIKLLLDRASAKRADGMTIDFVPAKGLEQGGFKIDNPNEPPKVQQLPAKQLKQWMDDGKPMEVFDVRPAAEREVAAIAGTRALEDDKDLLPKLEQDTVLVFFCHHGMRSQQAAEHCLRLGFKHVYNLAGGIDAWSREIDADVPRY